MNLLPFFRAKIELPASTGAMTIGEAKCSHDRADLAWLWPKPLARCLKIVIGHVCQVSHEAFAFLVAGPMHHCKEALENRTVPP